MKASLLLSALAVLAIGVAAAPRTVVVDYDGYKVFRVKTHGKLGAVEEKLSSLTYNQWTHDSATHIDIVVPPNQIDAFNALDLEFSVMHENLGESIVQEATSDSLYKRQSDPNAWFDSYHNYEDHIQYFRDLHDRFPNNSELVSSGISYQGRDIFGLHLWGAGGPGRPAVLYHGTVHAREWIAAPVRERPTNLQKTED